jgi:hypothetical protein
MELTVVGWLNTCFEARILDPMYSLPIWRRAPFIALLIVVIIISYAPATTQGTATVRLTALSAPSIVSHIYVEVSSMELHEQGYPNSTGWVMLSQSFPIIDLLASANQSPSQAIASASIHSGRYDTVKILFTNSTILIDGVRTPVAAPSLLSLSLTFPLSPNGNGDLLLVVAFDYAAIFASPPLLSFALIRVISV